MNSDPVVSFVEWHDYFLMTGTAAVTLLGLLFVALSFNLDVVLHESKTYLLSLARQTFLGFVYVLFVSLVFLIPAMTIRMLGAQVAIFGAATSVLALRGLITTARRRDRSRLGRFLIVRNLGSLAGGAFLAIAGLHLLRGDVSEMSMLASAMLVIFGVSAGSAWTLLVEVGRMKADLWPDRRGAP